jgi:hypothetical protein
MKQGVLAAARDRKADVRVSAATGLDDTAGQAAKLEALIEQRLDCYVVNPISQSNLVQPLSHVPEGVPIVNIDSPVGADDAHALGIKIATYIGTDNEAAGALAADTMAGLVGRGARVGVIGGISGDATSAARIEGFRPPRCRSIRTRSACSRSRPASPRRRVSRCRRRSTRRSRSSPGGTSRERRRRSEGRSSRSGARSPHSFAADPRALRCRRRARPLGRALHHWLPCPD